eukprot:scaffold91749_cov63-Phaeocystis_antarctica.AAC.1
MVLCGDMPRKRLLLKLTFRSSKSPNDLTTPCPPRCSIKGGRARRRTEPASAPVYDASDAGVCAPAAVRATADSSGAAGAAYDASEAQICSKVRRPAGSCRQHARQSAAIAGGASSGNLGRQRSFAAFPAASTGSMPAKGTTRLTISVQSIANE